MAWNDILGHDFVKHLWQSHLAYGTVANAYLLAGPSGVGKRRLALEMAKALNCAGLGQRPCDTCASCQQIQRHVHPDVHVIVPGGASEQIKIEDIRRLLGRIALRPFSATLQVVILDGAERLTEEAANSLLKALEEPPAHARFLLLTTQLSGCLPTIVSRCQLIRCHPLSADIVQHVLVEAHRVEPQVAQAVARLCQGSASQALALASRWNTYQQIVADLAGKDRAVWLAPAPAQTRQEVIELLDGMMRWLRDVAVAATTDAGHLVHAQHEPVLRRQAAAVDVDRCVSTALELWQLRESLEQFVSPRLVVALAREKWLSLIEAGDWKLEAGTS